MPIVLQSGGLNLLEPSGPVQACNWNDLPLIVYYLWNICCWIWGYLGTPQSKFVLFWCAKMKCSLLKQSFIYKQNIWVFLSQYLTNLMHKICFAKSFNSCLYMFRAHALIIRRSKLCYKASDIITPIGGRPVHETATYRFDDTRGCVMQFWPPDDEHMCSKHVEAWNKTYCKTNFVHHVG